MLFALDDIIGIRPVEIDGRYYLSFDDNTICIGCNKTFNFQAFFKNWHDNLPNQPLTDETLNNYMLWKLSYFKNHSSEIEHIEDEEDLEIYNNKAMAEYKKDPVTYSHEEVAKMLDIDKI